MFVLLGFAAQVCVICVSIALFVDMFCVVSAEHEALVSSASLPQSKVPLPHPVVSPDDEYYIVDDSNDDATQSASHCAKSIPVASYTVVIDEPIVSPVDYSTLTIRQLKALCRSRGIKRYSNLRKHELLALLA